MKNFRFIFYSHSPDIFIDGKKSERKFMNEHGWNIQAQNELKNQIKDELSSLKVSTNINDFESIKIKIKKGDTVQALALAVDNLAKEKYKKNHNIQRKLSKKEHQDKDININDQTLVHFPNGKKYFLKDIRNNPYIFEGQFITFKGKKNKTEIWIKNKIEIKSIPKNTKKTVNNPPQSKKEKKDTKPEEETTTKKTISILKIKKVKKTQKKPKIQKQKKVTDKKPIQPQISQKNIPHISTLPINTDPKKILPSAKLKPTKLEKNITPKNNENIPVTITPQILKVKPKVKLPKLTPKKLVKPTAQREKKSEKENPPASRPPIKPKKRVTPTKLTPEKLIPKKAAIKKTSHPKIPETSKTAEKNKKNLTLSDFLKNNNLNEFLTQESFTIEGITFNKKSPKEKDQKLVFEGSYKKSAITLSIFNLKKNSFSTHSEVKNPNTDLDFIQLSDFKNKTELQKTLKYFKEFLDDQLLKIKRQKEFIKKYKIPKNYQSASSIQKLIKMEKNKKIKIFKLFQPFTEYFRTDTEILQQKEKNIWTSVDGQRFFVMKKNIPQKITEDNPDVVKIDKPQKLKTRWKTTKKIHKFLKENTWSWIGSIADWTIGPNIYDKVAEISKKDIKARPSIQKRIEENDYIFENILQKKLQKFWKNKDKTTYKMSDEDLQNITRFMDGKLSIKGHQKFDKHSNSYVNDILPDFIGKAFNISLTGNLEVETDAAIDPTFYTFEDFFKALRKSRDKQRKEQKKSKK